MISEDSANRRWPKAVDDATKRVDDAAPKSKPPGHVEFDSRGNSVWHWDNEQADSTSKLLKSLGIDDLELEPTRSMKTPGKGKRPGEKAGNAPGEPRRSRRDEDEAPGVDDAPRGFDPYNRS